MTWFQAQFRGKTKQNEARTTKFFKDYQNSTSTKDDCYLRSLKNSQAHDFPNYARNYGTVSPITTYIMIVLIQCQKKVIQGKLLLHIFLNCITLKLHRF